MRFLSLILYLLGIILHQTDVQAIIPPPPSPPIINGTNSNSAAPLIHSTTTKKNTQKGEELKHEGLQSPLNQDFTEVISIATAPIDSVYNPIGNSICRIINHNRSTIGLRCKIKTSLGSIHNLEMLNKGEVDFALVQADSAKSALYGENAFIKNGNNHNLRFVLSLADEALTMLVKKENNKIRSFSDIHDTVIAIGATGSGSNTTIQSLFRVKKWTSKDFKIVMPLSSIEQPQALCNGVIEVMSIITSNPSPIIQAVSNMCEINILPVNDSDITSMVHNNKDFIFSVIPGGIYPGAPQDINTIAVRAILVTNSNTDDKVVYNITKAIFENLDYLKKVHPALGNLSPNNIMQGQVAPIHPGAQRYLTEKGYIKEEYVQ